jgi:hypothetical protein
MDFKDQIKQISDRVPKLKDQIHTEEGTKNSLIMPFLTCLGYDVFNPSEIMPEYTTDIGTKKGEKIDYAVMKEGVPIILIECKHWAENLTLHDNQLLRYFHVSKARFGILTNGIVYKFYTDLMEPNKMDEKPFFEFDLTDIKENQIEELKKFHKSYFDIDNIVNTASELKYTTELKTLISAEIANPSEGFVKFFAKEVYTSKITAKVLEQFTILTKKSFMQVISDIIQDRLKSAMKPEPELTAGAADTTSTVETDNQNSKIETTVEEMEAYFIVKAILRPVIDINRVVFRDTQSYFGILLDDNNRKPICRFYLHGAKKLIGTFDESKKETKTELQKLDDVFDHTEKLRIIVDSYSKFVK